MKKFLLLTVFSVVLFSPCLVFAQISGCTDPQSVNYNPAATINDGSCTYGATSLSLADKANLSTPMLNESSGLTFIDGKMWSFSDSGNPNDIYRVDTASGAILQTVDISNATNVDWEDMASNDNYLFIGDFGNNNGTRQDLKIYRINKTALTSTTTSVTASVINFSYSDQTSFPSLPTNNNFDCEAMIFLNDSIHLFSKNWVDKQTKHYVLPNTPGTHVAQYRETYNTGFLVTSASVQQFGVIALIGYLRSGTFPVSMAMIYDYKNHLLFNGNKRKFDLSTQLVYGQVEGIEFSNTATAFVTNELYTNGSTIPAKLRTVNIASYIPAAYLYPKPEAAFTANNLQVCSGNSVSFTDQSTDAPTSWQWSFPGGNPSSSSAQNPQVQYALPGTYSVTLIATNNAGADTLLKTNYITVLGAPNAPSAFSGNDIVCKNTTGNIFSVINSAGTNYTWSVPGGATITSGQGTNLIVVEFSGSAVNGNICVTANNGCGISSATCQLVKVAIASPSKPSAINGSLTQCAGTSGVIYSCSTIGSASSYNWIVPADVTILSGQGSNSVTLNFNQNFAIGILKVAAVNCLGSSAYKSVTIRAKPPIPGLVNGQIVEVCAGISGVNYSVSPVSGATSYQWTAPVNAAIVSGQGTNSVVVDYSASFVSGTLRVAAVNGCGSSNERVTTIRSVPSKPGIITGSTGVCANQTGVSYSIASVNGGTTYNWIVPAGATITSGQNTTAIAVNFGVNGGNIKVRAGNSCGNSGYRTLATAIVCKETDEDFVEIDVKVFPNPSSTEFTLQLNHLTKDAELIVRDVTGRIVERRKLAADENNIIFGNQLPRGFYIGELWTNRKMKSLKFSKW
ncbi:MAG: PKD domain-containing protein [Bacteroidetes bacterium]|nr:PKD domain-containing protein [Bacteroidota bacterium]